MKKSFFTVLFAVLLQVSMIFAQTPTGRLTGIVSGPDGVLPNATVTVTFNQTGRTQTATTNDDGSFSFAQLEPGLYTVTITSGGFKTLTANEVKIDIGREYNLTPTLEIGGVQETVTVTAGADVITSTTAQITNTVSPQQILSLPLVERNPLDLIALQPGAVSNPQTGLTTINGMRTSTTNTTRDGISINDPYIRSNATDFAPGRPSVDDTGEFTITTSNQESDQGGGSAQVTLVTPRGTREFHGALFAYNRNSYFAANEFFNKLDGVERPFRNRNQFGGKIGGMVPVPNFGENDGPLFLKDKAFFFFAYEGVKDPDTDRYTRTILTPSARAGTLTFQRSAAGVPFSRDGLSCPSGDLNSTCTVTNILAFAQAQGFQGIPSTINPVIQQRILNNMPAEGNSTTVGDQLNTTGFSLNRAFSASRNTYTTRLDFDATEKDNLSFVYSFNREDILRPDVDDTGFSPSPDVTQFGTGDTKTFAYRRAFTNNFVNEFRYGRFESQAPFDRISEYPAYNLGPGGVTTSGQQGLIAGLISNPENIFLDQGRASVVRTFADNANLIIGKHSLRFGGQYQRYNVVAYNDVLIVPFYNIGTTNVSTATSTTFQTTSFANVCAGTCAPNAASVVNATQLGQANGLLALLGGLVNGATQAFNMRDISSGYLPNERQQTPFTNWNHALYVTDRWQVARGLTVNGGVRWEIYPSLRLDTGLALEPTVDPDNPVSSLLAGNGQFNIIGTNAGTDDYRYYKTDLNNFAPSVSFAYTPNFEKGIGSLLFGREGRTVIRGGYSSAYANDQIITSLSSSLSTNVGLGRQSVAAIGPNGTSALNARVGESLPTIPIPVFSGQTTRSFLQNNTAAQSFFGVAGVTDPKLQIPRTDQYTFGVQRELPGNMVFEARYVGGRSDNLVRGYNPNQIDIINNGFLTDFKRAQANLALTGTTAFCNPQTVTGCQALTLFRTGTGASQIGTGPLVVGTTLTATTFNTQLRNGSVADLAQAFVTGNLNNHPSLANPTATPFVNFYPNPNIGTINLLTNAGRYRYNGLQMELRRRFSDGLYFQGNYTFSKTLTNGRGSVQSLSEPFLQNQNPDLDYQRADNDITHVFNFNGIYQLPFGRGKRFLSEGGFLNLLVGGWEISGLVTIQSGVPITFIDTRGTLNRGALSGQQTVSSSLSVDEIRNLVGFYEKDGNFYYLDPSILGPTGQGATGYFDPNLPGLNGNTAFEGQVFFLNAPGTTGNLPRAFINGPMYWNANASLMKNFRISESVRFQIRAEAFNLFNNVNFRPGAQYNSPTALTFGQLTSTTGPREMQFAARFEF